MNSFITVSELGGGLEEEAEVRMQKIETIKQEVAQDWDNINNPIPFMTEAPVYEMSD